MTNPQRIQRRRTKGWRMPEGAIYVGRPTRWGNPFTVVNGFHQGWLIFDDRPEHRGGGYIATLPTKPLAQARAVLLYRTSVVKKLELIPLVGHDLVCWCPPDWPCHADVLLELANTQTGA